MCNIKNDIQKREKIKVCIHVAFGMWMYVTTIPPKKHTAL